MQQSCCLTNHIKSLQFVHDHGQDGGQDNGQVQDVAHRGHEALQIRGANEPCQKFEPKKEETNELGPMQGPVDEV